MNDLFFKVAALVIITALLVVTLKNYKPEYGFLLSVGAGVLIITVVVSNVFPAVKNLQKIYTTSSGSKYDFSVVIKAVVISYITQFCENTCKDFGASSLADKVEFAGRCAILILSIPLISSIFETAIGFTKI